MGNVDNLIQRPNRRPNDDNAVYAVFGGDGVEDGKMNELAKEIHELAKTKGWWKPAPSFGEIIALCHSELSEALEEYRSGHKNIWFACTECNSGRPCEPQDEGDCLNFGLEYCKYRSEKPEGIAIELADCIIRILDYCNAVGIDIDHAVKIKHEYNKSREYRHGGKVL